MSDLTRMGAKPVTLTVGGEEYSFSPLTLDDLAEFESWHASERLNRALDALGDAGDRVTLITKLADAPAADIAEAMQSLRGVRQILWYSLRKQHPDLTPNDAGALVDFSNLAEFRTLIDSLAGLGDEETTNNPPARRRSARGPASS
jgi:hypothetical protein